ncbi:MAG: dihydroorotase [Bacteroidales bacterium]|nr:dihydroorotase [Bacteroidales bacterium]
MMKTLIKNTTIINEGTRMLGSVLIEKDKISAVYFGNLPEIDLANVTIIDGTGKWLIPGVIDDQVHFREPGLTQKGDITSESRAAVAGGVTSFMDMPNTKPQTVTIEELNKKFDRAAEVSVANYSFYMGATNDNLTEVLKADPKRTCGVKVFMGSSTGNMLVDSEKTLSGIFSEVEMLIATHCEKEEVIKANVAKYTALYGEDLPLKYHPMIRDAEACYQSSAEAVALATKYNARLHVLHLSSAKEMSLFEQKPLTEKRITGEVCVHHLWFDDRDYEEYGNKIKWNPSIKSESDKLALRDALINGRLDVVATDHAPHLLSEKEGGCFKAYSGGPLVQHSLTAMLEMALQGIFSLELVIDKMCHAPATLYRVENRGFIREGYFADLVLVNPNREWTVSSTNILYKCGWSPFEGNSFRTKVEKTFVNGILAYDNGIFDETCRGKELQFVHS